MPTTREPTPVPVSDAARDDVVQPPHRAGTVRGTIAMVRARLGRTSMAALGSFALKGVGTLVLFGYGMLLARTLGVVEYGAYEVAIAWLTLAVVPALGGFDKVVLRVVATARANGRWSEAVGLARWSTGAVLALSLATGACIAAFAGPSDPLAPGAGALVLIAAIVPFHALTMLWESIVRGLGAVVVGQVPVLLLRPLTAIVAIAAAVYGLGAAATAATAMTTFAIASVLAMLTVFLLLARAAPTAMRRAQAVYPVRSWVRSAWPVAVMAGLYVVNGRIGTIVLGALGDPAAAGIFALASRAGDLVMFGMVAVNAVLAPMYAALHAEGDVSAFQRGVTRGARLVFALSAPIAAVLFVAAPWFLALFGEEFVVGSSALRVLLSGHLVNVALGSVGVILVMAGRERAAMLGFGIGTASNLIATVWLAPAHGFMGAAWAALGSMIVLYAVLWVLTWRLLGIDASVVGLGPRRPVVRSGG